MLWKRVASALRGAVKKYAEVKVSQNDLRKLLMLRENQLNELQSKVRSLELNAVPKSQSEGGLEVDQLKVWD